VQRACVTSSDFCALTQGCQRKYSVNNGWRSSALGLLTFSNVFD
jgi:hypothetical protein